MTFWILAAIALFAAALVTFLPLLRGKSLWQPAALALTFLLPAAGLWIYGEVGTPEAIGLPSAPASTAAPHAAATGADSDAEIDAMIGGLRARLTNAPEDLDGWMLLARTLKTVQRYPEALDALQVAHGMAPDNPAVMVELAEAQIFVSANGQIDSDSVAMLERAIEMDPGQQKGLWLLGIAAAQGGDLDGALAYWETLLGQLEPGSPVAQSVQTQIDEANARLGRPLEPQAAPPTAPATTPPTAPATTPATGSVAQEPSAASEPVGDGSWRGTPVRIVAGDEARAKIPTGATMFVIIRSPGPAMGPPLGVRRVVDPLLPLDITINDQDSMLKERKISLESEVQLQARISLSGSPAAASGDWQSAPVVVPLSAVGTVELILDQQVE